MEILEKYWNGEKIKAVFNFSTPFTVYTEEVQGTFIRSLEFHFINNNTTVNPVGIVQSSTLTLEVYTPDDSLNPTNINSIYYDELVNGLEVDIFVDRGKNGEYKPYGKWFVSSWNGGFSEGINNINSISLEDRLNSEFSVSMPKLEARGNTNVGSLIEEVFEKIGLDSSEYIIDADLDLNLTFSIFSGGKVRDFLNSACALLMAKVRVDLEGIIHVEKALNFNEFNNEISLCADDFSSLSSTNTESINYNKIVLNYISNQNSSREVIVDEILDALAVGENEFNFSLNKIILSIEQVRLEVLNSTSIISEVITSGFQKEIDLSIIVEGESSTYSHIYIEGIVASSKKSSVSAEITGASQRGGITYTLDLEQILSEEEAEDVLNRIKYYIKAVSKRVNISGSILTSEIQPGDKLTISEAGSYDGVYKVLSNEVSYGSDYMHNLELIRIEGEY